MRGGGAARWQVLDVTRRAGVKAFVDAAYEWHGRLDVLINNAGVMPLSPLEALKVDKWDRIIDVDIRGVLRGIAATLTHMQAQGKGSGQIIKPVVDRGHTVSPTAAVYCGTKFG